jgi:predicted KAP-like P-loop ATPase
MHFITNKVKKKNSQLSDASNSNRISADVPISTEKEDVLNRKNFVENLKDIISKHALNEESVRICIDAKWGEGKTSVFNLLKGKLTEEKNIMKRKILST